jgi:hypothetical protein
MLPRGAASGTPRPTRLLPEWPVPRGTWISRLEPLDLSNPLTPFPFACYHLCWSRVNVVLADRTSVWPARSTSGAWRPVGSSSRPVLISASARPRLAGLSVPPRFSSVLSKRTALSCSGGLLTRTAEIRHQTAQPTRNGCLLGRRVRPRQLLSNSALPLADPRRAPQRCEPVPLLRPQVRRGARPRPAGYWHRNF